jgi:CheY-like chemotaxis protein
MPGINGWRVLQEIKTDSHLAHIPVIMLTVVDNEPRGLALGASSYLMKPVGKDRLAILLQQYRLARSSGESGSSLAPESVAICD